MIRTTIACFVMIMTNIVSANAAFNDVKEARIEKAAWNAAYVGQTQVDGINVVAALEVAQHEIVVPEMLSGDFQSLVPLAPVKKQLYRLILVAVENHKLRAEYALNSKVASVDGQLKKVYLSAPDSDISFLITTEDNGMLRVQFSKKLAQTNSEEGEFHLEPVMNTLKK
jgi:hypothetical protein